MVHFIGNPMKIDENWGYPYEPFKSNTEFPYLHSSPLSFTPGLAAGHRAAQQAIKLQEAILDVIRLGFLASVLLGMMIPKI